MLYLWVLLTHVQTSKHVSRIIICVVGESVCVGGGAGGAGEGRDRLRSILLITVYYCLGPTYFQCKRLALM